MHFIAISINHRTADVALREQVAFRDDALRLANEDLFETKAILENVILSTCNRTEVYAVVDQFIQDDIIFNDFSSFIWI